MDRRELQELLASRSDPAAQCLLAALDAEQSVELIVVSRVRAQELLHTYSVRLQRFEDGEGPESIGLPDFVRALRAHSEVELLGVTAQAVAGICLLSPGGELIAVTTVQRRPQDEPMEV